MVTVFCFRFLCSGSIALKNRKQKGNMLAWKVYLMKGTIYLWVLAAVLSGALVGLLGFAFEGVFNLQSSFMEPVIVGAIAGVVAVLITVALFRNGKAD
jgi:hypothetical protein